MVGAMMLLVFQHLVLNSLACQLYIQLANIKIYIHQMCKAGLLGNLGISTNSGNKGAKSYSHHHQTPRYPQEQGKRGFKTWD